jgi:hypothetical protein
MPGIDRWESKLGRFVHSFGADRLADQLNVDRSVVFKWVRGAAAAHPAKAFAIQDLARSSGFSMSLEDIYTNFRPRVRIRRRNP